MLLLNLQNLAKKDKECSCECFGESGPWSTLCTKVSYDWVDFFFFCFFKVPVYGQVGAPESYTQNDQPLEFGTVSDAGYQLPGVPGEEPPPAINQSHVEPVEVSHPPETYKAVPTGKTFYWNLTYLTHYHTMPHFDAVKIYNCNKQFLLFSQCFLPYVAIIIRLSKTGRIMGSPMAGVRFFVRSISPKLY